MKYNHKCKANRITDVKSMSWICSQGWKNLPPCDLQRCHPIAAVFKWNSRWVFGQHKSVFSKSVMLLVETGHICHTKQMKTDSIKHFPLPGFVPWTCPHNGNMPQAEFGSFENNKTELILCQRMQCQPNTSRMSKRQMRQSYLAPGSKRCHHTYL